MVIADAQRLAEQQAHAKVAAVDYAAAVRNGYGPRIRWIRLFGSLARGDWMGPDESDIDVAIVLDRRAFTDEMHLVDLATHLGWRHAVAISPKIFSADEFDALRQRELSLADDIVAEGVVL